MGPIEYFILTAADQKYINCLISCIKLRPFDSQPVLYCMISYKKVMYKNDINFVNLIQTESKLLIKTTNIQIQVHCF